MSKEELESLSERVRKAEGPDRGLDADLALLDGWTELPGDNWIKPGAGICVPAYTASIDAAVALVEKCGHGWNLQGNRTAFHAMVSNVAGVSRPSPALALLDAYIAMLIKAKILYPED